MLEMSQQSRQNLKTAVAVKRSGFKSLLDAQPAMRKRLAELYHDGSNTQAIYITLVKEFPGEHVPSRQQLNVYIRRNLIKTVEVSPYLPAYNRLLKGFDPFVQQHQICLEAKRQYEWAKAGKLGMRTQSMLLERFGKQTERLQGMALSMGLVQAVRQENMAVAGTSVSATGQPDGDSQERLRSINATVSELRQQQDEIIAMGGIGATE